MNIVEYFSDRERHVDILAELRKCEWGAGKFLLRLLTEGTFAKTLGDDGKLFCLMEGKHLLSFLTLTRQDCVDAPKDFPWIGFVYTTSDHRGHRYAGILLDQARRCAGEMAFPRVFLATGHTGLYEKYGFAYLENRPDIDGEDSRIYTAPAISPVLFLETERLILRELGRDDFPELLRILSDRETMQYYPAPFDKEKVRCWIEWNLENYQKFGFGLWGVIAKATGELLGDCGLTMQNIYGKLLPEIGYHIDRRFWNRGFATEAASACLRYIWEHTAFDEIFSYQKFTNMPSRRVAEKIGMTFREEYPDSVNIKTSVYSIRK